MIDFLQFAQERGLIITHLESNKWARVPTIDHPNKRNGAYFYSGDYAHVQNWAIMETVETWQDKKPRTPFEQKNIEARIASDREKHSKERERKQIRAASKAKWILSQCELDQHAYLDSKNFKDTRGNVWRQPDQDPVLVIPMFYDNSICGCQLIDIHGSKKYLFGQRTNNSYFRIGQGKKVFLVEGYASGLSLQAILTALKIQASIYITFSAGNCSKIAKTHPDAFWVADNDLSQTGQKSAIESGLRWWMPEQLGFDINDLHKESGTFKASQILRKVLLAR